ncbi:hypothetical protein RND71_000804 [Anisodus tanguticus]|uniref:Transcription factor CBF/NF-Y/archaeal histone domain-containing protein n=1 Tax=Anisodus tanguticus TaxID=243964 RepID=A0AAE1SZK9_9SOLA|nr:hypothetical protein RND71_000804 [Anisodus tanguticus]
MVDEHVKLVPIANVGRIIKQILPPTAKISKEAKETIQECASEFISFVTGEASDKCHKENRRTVNGDDICWALSSLGFDNYAEAMLKYLYKLREFERLRVNQNKGSNDDEDNTDEECASESEKQEITTTSTSPASLKFNVMEMVERSN